MADQMKTAESGGTEEFRALADVRAALEVVEAEQVSLDRERRRLRENLDGLLTSLRDGGLLLLFDAEGELFGAEGAFEDHLGAELDDLVKRFDDFAPPETRESLADANESVMKADSAGVAVSRSFLQAGDDRLGLTWVHLRRHDDDDTLVGTEVIGLPSLTPAADDDAAGGESPFDALMHSIGARLLDSSEESTIRRAIEQYGTIIGADRVVINRYDEDGRTFSVMTSWRRGKIEPLAAETAGIAISAFPWAYSQLGADEAVVISEKADLPSEARAEKRIYARDGVKSSLLVPMVRGDHLFGFVSIQSVERRRDWDAEDVARARSFVRLLTGTLARRELETQLAGAVDTAESASRKADEADERREKAEDQAKQSVEEVESLSSQAEEAQRRIEQLEKDVDKLEKAEREARSSVEDELVRAKEARKEVEKDLEKVRAEAEQAERRADDAEERVESLRAELEEAQQEAAKVIAEASSSAELREMDRAGERVTEHAQRAASKLTALGELSREPAIELRGARAAAGGFDPDATLEMEFSSLVKRRRGGGSDDVVAKVAELDEAEAAIEFPSRSSETDLHRGFDLEGMLQRTESQAASGLHQAGDGIQSPPWPGFADDSIPSWLQDEDEVDADRDEDDREAFGDHGHGRDEDDDERDHGERDHDEREDEERDDEGRDDIHLQDDTAGDEYDEDDAYGADDFFVEGEDQSELHDESNGRSVARRAADIDEGRSDTDWWGVRVDDEGDDAEVEADNERSDADEGECSEAEDDERFTSADENPDEDSDEDAIVFETAWDRQEDEEAGWEAEPSVPFIVQEEGAAFEDHADDAYDRGPVPISELAGIDAEIGLQDVGGNEELYRSLLLKFRGDYSGAGAKIDAAIEKGNIEVAHLLLHAIKGVSGILGATRLHQAADELETRLIGTDAAATRQSGDEFISALEEVLVSIDSLDQSAESAESAESDADADADSPAWDEEPDGHADGVSDPMVLRSYLSGLRQHLLTEKQRQCRLVMQEIDARTWPEEFAGPTRELGELIRAGNLSEARDVFEEIMEIFEQA